MAQVVPEPNPLLKELKSYILYTDGSKKFINHWFEDNELLKIDSTDKRLNKIVVCICSDDDIYMYKENKDMSDYVYQPINNMKFMRRSDYGFYKLDTHRHSFTEVIREQNFDTDNRDRPWVPVSNIKSINVTENQHSHSMEWIRSKK